MTEIEHAKLTDEDFDRYIVDTATRMLMTSGDVEQVVRFLTVTVEDRGYRPPYGQRLVPDPEVAEPEDAAE